MERAHRSVITGPRIWLPPAGGGGPATGLDFGGNVDYPSATPSSRFVWTSTLSVAPFPAYPATYIQKVFPRSGQPLNNDNFWSGLFHADYVDDFFLPGRGIELEYYGMHPYPDILDSNRFEWEISSDANDMSLDEVVFDQWYTHVIIVDKDATNTYHTYYWNYPTLTDVMTVDPGALKDPAVAPCIVIGDAPWNIGFENYKGVIRGLQFYDVALTLAQVDQELATPGSFRTPWYLNLNPTPDDITDKSGNGNHPVWVGANRPALWTE